MNRPGSKPPAFRPQFKDAPGRTKPPVLAPVVPAVPAAPAAPVAGLSLGARVGLGVAIGLFSSLGVVIGGAVIVALTGGQADVVAEMDADTQGVAARPAPPTDHPSDPLRSLPEEVRRALENAKQQAQDNERRMAGERDSAESVRAEDDTPAQETSNEETSNEETSNEETSNEETSNEEQHSGQDPGPPPAQHPPAAQTVEVGEEALIWVRELQGRTFAVPAQGGFVASNRATKLAEPSSDQKTRISGTMPVASAIALKLLGTDVVYGDEDAVLLEDKRQDQQVQDRQPAVSERFLNEATWIVRTKKDGAGGTAELGRFAVHDNCLTFQWNRGAARTHAAASLLKYCLLEVSAGKRGSRHERAVCRLGVPVVVELRAVNLLDANARIECSSLDADALPPAEHLRMDVVFRGFPEHEKLTESGVGVDEVLTAQFFADGQVDSEQAGVEVDARFQLDEHPAVLFDVAAYPIRIVQGIENSDKVSFDIEEKRDFSAELRQERSKLKMLKKKNEKRQFALQTDLRTIQVALQRSPANRTMLQKRIQELQDQFVAIQVESVQAEDELSRLDLENQWRTEVSELFSPAQSDRRIGIKLFVEIDGQQVMIAAPKPDESSEEVD